MDGNCSDMCSLHILRVARDLEKIADITTNICEEVVYIKEGKVVKHGGYE